jgi:multiple sugar transport system substrate-binding protein
MNMLKTLALTSAFAVLSGTTAMAGCGITAGNISILGNDFPAIQAVTAAAKACEGDGVTVNVNLTTEHENLQVAALTANPAEYSVAIIATSSIVPLLNDGLIRPLDDLVAKHGQNLSPNQLITIDGKVMAVAFMANAQHLYYRKDILDQLGLAAPTTYEEVLAAAEAIKAAGLMDAPFALNTGVGWNLGEEFVNMHLGMGGSFFKEGTAEPAINTETGIATLNMLKSLVAYSGPDFLTFDSNATQAQWEAGNLALATMWGSRGGAILDGEGSTAEITGATMLAAAPNVGGGAIPATTLWWDGFTIAANVSDADAEASFIAMVNGISDEVVTANADAAVWLSAAYSPTPASAGVIASAQGGALSYPMLPYMGLMHMAADGNLADFLQGNESAEQALADIEAAYVTAAKEQGFLQ